MSSKTSSRDPSMSTQFANSFLQGVQNHSQAQQLKGENEALGRETGVNLSGIRDPDLRKVLIQNAMKKKEDKGIEKQQVLEGIESTIGEMESLISESGIGRSGMLNQSQKAYYNRGLMKTLSSDLLNFYKTLFPRGITQGEFKKLESDYIPNEWDTEGSMRGKLEGFKKLIQRKLDMTEDNQEKKEKSKFNPEHPEHKAKAQQLFKKFGDKERVRKELSREFEI